MGPPGQQAGDAAVAGGMARPPFLYLGCLVVGFALDRALPLPVAFPEAALMSWMAGGAMVLIGFAIVAAGARNFSRAATPVPSNKPVRTLVTTGVHGWSRNPIYFGMMLLYAGVGIAAHSPWVLVVALPLVVILRYRVVAREEAYLERRFGDVYREYKARVRRWL